MARRRDQRRIAGRQLSVRVKSAKGRRSSSTRWLQRQLNDPYVAAAGRDGYRSRAAFKLLELDERFRLLKPQAKVVDLGAAPGGWTQVAIEQTSASRREGKTSIVAVDLVELEPIPGATILTLEIEDESSAKTIRETLGGPADLVLSDMAPNFSGHRTTDKLRTAALVEAAAILAYEILSPGGSFVAKVFHGGTEPSLLVEIKKRFATVRHAKPPASRAESAEIYLVAQGFRGNAG